jgi:hypothetical protein
MQLLKLFLAAALVLDAALVLTTTAAPTIAPAQAVGFNSNASSNGSFSLAGAANANNQ